MVLSLTTEADGNEPQYASIVAEELGVPPLDVKVVPADENRFGSGHGYNTSPSGGTAGGDHQRQRQDPRQGAAARGRGARDRRPPVGQRRVRRQRRAAHDRRHRALRARHRGAAPGRRGRARRTDCLQGLRNAHAWTTGRRADRPHRQGRRRRQGGPRADDRGHALEGHDRPRGDDAHRRPALAARARGHRRHDRRSATTTRTGSRRRSTRRSSRAARSSSAPPASSSAARASRSPAIWSCSGSSARSTSRSTSTKPAGSPAARSSSRPTGR